MKTRLLIASGELKDLRLHLKKMAEAADFNAERLIAVGETQLRYSYLADAQYTLFKALQERPKDIPLQARVGDLELALGNLENAAQRAQELIAQHPLHPAGYALKGDVLVAQEKFTESAEAYAQARTREGGNRPEIALKHFEVLVQAQQQAAAEQVLAEWLAVHPQANWAALRLAGLAFGQGDYAVAKTRYVNLLIQEPNNVEALNNLANTLLLQGDFPGAEARARQALEHAPDNPYVLDTLGWSLVRAERHEDALQYLREARTRAASVPEIRYHLAVALERLGRRAEALEELEPAVAEGLEFRERDDAVQLVNKLRG
jgi:cellulose synthase operon protein C